MFCIEPPPSLYTYDGESILAESSPWKIPYITDHSPTDGGWGDARERRTFYGRTVAECARWIRTAYERNGFTSAIHGELEDWKLPNMQPADIDDDTDFDGRTYHNREWWKHWWTQQQTLITAQANHKFKVVGGVTIGEHVDERGDAVTQMLNNVWDNPVGHPMAQAGKMSRFGMPRHFFPWTLRDSLGSSAHTWNRASDPNRLYRQSWDVAIPLGVRRIHGTYVRTNTLREQCGWWAEDGPIIRFKKVRGVPTFTAGVTGWSIPSHPSYPNLNYEGPFIPGSGAWISNAIAATSVGDWPASWVRSGNLLRNFAAPLGGELTLPLEPLLDFSANLSGWMNPEFGGGAAFILRFYDTDFPASGYDVAPTTLDDRKHWYPLGPVWYDPYNIDPPNESMFKIKLGVDAPLMG
ncbi:hypothetical protein SH661x_003894 [Planctomicrobium sp. SH661]|uniref:hypothetical protein n=1 Tax=Planctomicrobium sp. SH661 TaxID=3448124 RepID=UPI003F5BFB77